MFGSINACNDTRKGAHNSQGLERLQCRPRVGEGANKRVGGEVPVGKIKIRINTHGAQQWGSTRMATCMICINTKACNDTWKGAHNSQIQKGLQSRPRRGERSKKLVAIKVPVSKKHQGQPTRPSLAVLTLNIAHPKYCAACDETLEVVHRPPQHVLGAVFKYVQGPYIYVGACVHA